MGKWVGPLQSSAVASRDGTDRSVRRRHRPGSSTPLEVYRITGPPFSEDIDCLNRGRNYRARIPQQIRLRYGVQQFCMLQCT